MSAATVTTLANGLTVILKEIHTAPVISWWLMYRVGSRNERTGSTGISHWVEHMMFKGTPRYPAGTLDRLIDRAGGQWNASTSLDYTVYYETLPAERIELALEAEADRMVNALFEPEEVDAERTVVMSERRDNENSPTFWLSEEIRAAAFRVHGYHHEIIGDMVDLQTMTRADLYAHYRACYVPANAVAVAAGAFDTAALLAQIEALYGPLPAAPAPAAFVRPEPPQQGERRLQVERPGNTAFVIVAFRAPRALDPDWLRLELLDSILTGPGGGVDNKTSRLYQALVKTGLAAHVGGGLQETIDPYLYSFRATVSDGRTPAQVEAALLTEIDRVLQDGISPAELAKARKQATAAFAYSTESITNQAYWLTQSAVLGDYGWFETYLDRLHAITRDEVQAAARRYLVPRNRIVGWLLPAGQPEAHA
ncbi:MAG: insulinase family protein [Anaerolineae bacterium]|nr:insulinase family protein [Anaerolineae bacterium]